MPSDFVQFCAMERKPYAHSVGNLSFLKVSVAQIIRYLVLLKRCSVMEKAFTSTLPKQDVV